jgi:hypothetical protein
MLLEPQRAGRGVKASNGTLHIRRSSQPGCKHERTDCNYTDCGAGRMCSVMYVLFCSTRGTAALVLTRIVLIENGLHELVCGWAKRCPSPRTEQIDDS